MPYSPSTFTPSTNLRVPSTLILLAGLVTGITLLTLAHHYYRRPDSSSATPDLDSDPAGAFTASSLNSSRTRRQRRRRRRNEREEQLQAQQDYDEGDVVLPPLPAESDEEDDDDDSALGALFSESKEDSQNLLNLLYAIAEDQARKEGYIHRGITCNKCSISPIRGLRYKCANCVDFDLCETCEAGDNHVKTHVFLKIRIPIPPLANPRSALLPAFYPGKDVTGSSLTWAKLRELQKKTHFDQVELEALYEQFKSLSTVEEGEGGIDKETFEQCLGPLGLEKNLITERIFSFFDQDGNGVIDFAELVCGLSILCKGNLDEKIKYAFKGYDLDGDGYISREELSKMFKAYFYLSMELVRDVVKAMEDDMMDGFEFQASQPVSSAFTAAIPQPPVEAHTPVEGEEDPEEGRYPQKESYFRSAREEDGGGASSWSSAVQAQGSSSTHRPIALSWHTPAMPSTIDTTELPTSTMVTTPSAASPYPPPSVLVPTLYPDPPRKPWEEKFPIMESMSQDAIEEMVEKTFKSIETEREGFISYEEFRLFVQTDSSIVSWFEALGTVF